MEYQKTYWKRVFLLIGKEITPRPQAEQRGGEAYEQYYSCGLIEEKGTILRSFVVLEEEKLQLQKPLETHIRHS